MLALIDMKNVTPKDLYEFLRIELYKDKIRNNLTTNAQAELVGCKPFTISQFNYRARDPTKQPPAIYHILCYLINNGTIKINI